MKYFLTINHYSRFNFDFNLKNFFFVSVYFMLGKKNNLVCV